MVFIKQMVGIDVSKDTLDVRYGKMDQQQEIQMTKTKSFKNSTAGFEKLLAWVNEKKGDLEAPLWYIMEATGVYYENLAYFLAGADKQVCVLLPSKLRNFARSLKKKSKTDPIDAATLVKIGLERKLEAWKIPGPLMAEIRALTREYQETGVKLVATRNQLHAKQHAYKSPKSSIRRLKRQIKLYEAQRTQIEAELRALVCEDEKLQDRIDRIETIPGVRFITIITIIGETNGFALIRNSRQLVSYAGLDIVHHESGKKKKKSRISKRGNKHIRAALYMPALSASQHNPILKKFYDRLSERKEFKKAAVSAVSRKLLILIYTLWKTETAFNADHQWG